jgi:3-deoxy-D-manno-octulosonic-acid transferase
MLTHRCPRASSRLPTINDKTTNRAPRQRMLRFFYTALLYLSAPIALCVLAVRGLRDPAYRGRLGERLGYSSAQPRAPAIWVHAVSVGEVQAAAALIRSLRERFPHHAVLMTTATPTGAQRVYALFGESVQHCYLPYDLPGAVRRFLHRFRPSIAIIMEREIWPNLFDACSRRGIPVLLASARLSERSARFHRRFTGLFARALDRNVTIAAQTAIDAQRFAAIGSVAARVEVTGNVKFDLEIADDVRRSGAALRAGPFAGRFVWVAGSTHAVEEEAVLRAHEQVRSTRADALLVLVPRHPNRFDQVRAWLSSRNVAHSLRSTNTPVTGETSVLLADTLGELLVLYAAADLAFVGGSLVPVGGHNLLEPAALARPIVVGPHNFNGQDIAQMLIESGAAVEVADGAALGRVVLDLAADAGRREAMGAAGRAVVEANRGAIERIIRLADALLPKSAGDPSSR